MSSEFSIVDPIGADDVSEILNVTEARVRQLTHVLRPISIRGRLVYSRQAVLRYAADRDSRKGRA